MSDLVVIPLADGPMTDNLNTALALTGPKPWGFNSYLSNMKSVQPGVHLVFLRMTRPDGGAIGKQSAYPADAVTHRVVLGRILSPVAQTSTPYFTGFPQAFTWESVADQSFTTPLTLEETGGWLNERVPALEIGADQLHTLLSNARSSKLGAYFDGEPRRAEYFKNVPGSPTSSAATPATAIPRPAATQSQLETAVEHFVAAVAGSHLTFKGLNAELPRAFLAALMTKRFVLLTGLAGSGKTQLARVFGRWLDPELRRTMVVPVRADWTTPEPMLGYEDALLPVVRSQRAWNVPAALDFVLRAARDPELPYTLVLDEMNLAHVERYFADVLSGLESGEPMVPNVEKDANGYWYPVASGPALLPWPPNLFIIGTVNVDETTYQFSPKVLDRSFSFEFRVSTEELDAELRSIRAPVAAESAHVSSFMAIATDPDWHLGRSASDADDLSGRLIEVHRRLAECGLEFGHRSFREALRLGLVLDESGLHDIDDITDWVIMTKVLPRVHGSRRQLEQLLRGLLLMANGEDADKPKYPLVARKLTRMVESLVANQYAGFAE